MKKIISAALICSMLFSASSTIYVNAESAESKLKANQEKQDELDKAERAHETEDGNEKKLAKKIKKLKEEIKSIQQDLTKRSSWSNFALMGLLLVINRLTRSYFEGHICCKIPFTPWTFIQRITHGGIDSTDMTDGSFNFIYWLSAILFKDAMNRIFGFIVPGGNMMDQMQSRLMNQQ